MFLSFQQQIIRYYRWILRTTKFFITEIKLKVFNNSTKLKMEYINWLFEENAQKNSKDFIAETDSCLNIPEDITKIIAFYLPQYYENDINNKYFGKGFMEWYKSSKAIPQFTGHYQPHLPIDVGFYNLTHDDIMYRQIELAKKYGIYGFCFYWYWFSGDVLLEKPINNFLNNKNLNIPFCIMWTNETWTNVWGNGDHREIIKEQHLKADDDEKFIHDIVRFFSDERYIKINGKPLLIIYQSQFFEKERFKNFIKNIRANIKNYGFNDIHIMTTNSGYTKIDTQGLNLDSVVEFSHQNLQITKYISDMKNIFINPLFKGKIIDIKRALKEELHLKENSYKTFKCIYPGWDNSPRKAYSNNCYVLDINPEIFKKWLKDIIIWTKQKHNKDEQFVFINAWNEWAEGAHLEPDQKYGYAYLQAVKDVLEETR